MRRRLIGGSAWHAAVVASLILASCGTSADVGPTIYISNVDGPTARVVAWQGASAVIVTCASARTISSQGAPPLPWDLTVSDASTGRELFSHSVTGTLYLIVRSDGVLWGAEPGSGGPAPQGCH